MLCSALHVGGGKSSVGRQVAFPGLHGLEERLRNVGDGGRAASAAWADPVQMWALFLEWVLMTAEMGRCSGQ